MRAYHVLSAVLVACMASTAMADPGHSDNDAASGSDAGNTQAQALLVEYGRLYQGRVRGNDVDWFAAQYGTSAPSCIRVTATASTSSYFTLGQQDTTGSMSAPILVGSGARAAGGIAGLSPLSTSLRVARASGVDGPGHYDFQLDRIGPSLGTDAGTADAGTGVDALPTAPGCVPGMLTGISDGADGYKITVQPGEVVTYSFATSGTGATLTLLNAAGQAVGPALQSGELAEVPLSTGGTYFLTAQRSASFSEVGYVAGIVVGPDPSGCRPYCMG